MFHQIELPDRQQLHGLGFKGLGEIVRSVTLKDQRPKGVDEIIYSDVVDSDRSWASLTMQACRLREQGKIEDAEALEEQLCVVDQLRRASKLLFGATFSSQFLMVESEFIARLPEALKTVCEASGIAIIKEACEESRKRAGIFLQQTPHDPLGHFIMDCLATEDDTQIHALLSNFTVDPAGVESHELLKRKFYSMFARKLADLAPYEIAPRIVFDTLTDTDQE